MQTDLSKQAIQHRNQLIVDFLSSANGEEVHVNDIAWFLQLDPHQVDCWMREHGFGKWITGKKAFCWQGIARKSVDIGWKFSNGDQKSMDCITNLE